MGASCDKIWLADEVFEEQFTPGLGVTDKEHAIYLLNSIGVNRVNAFNTTPLYWATSCQEEEIVGLLLQRGADVNKGTIYVVFYLGVSHRQLVKLRTWLVYWKTKDFPL